MYLARWHLADLPRLLAVDSRLSDRTVVRSRRELRQHAPATFCFLDPIILIIGRQIFLGPKTARVTGVKAISNPSKTCFLHVNYEQVAWSHVKVSRDHEVLDPRSLNFDIRLLEFNLSIERVFLAEKCVRKSLASSNQICWSKRRSVISNLQDFNRESTFRII